MKDLFDIYDDINRYLECGFIVEGYSEKQISIIKQCAVKLTKINPVVHPESWNDTVDETANRIYKLFTIGD